MFIKQHFRVQESCIKLTICLLYSLGSKHFLARTRAATLVTQPRLRKGERFIVLNSALLYSAFLCSMCGELGTRVFIVGLSSVQ